MKIMNNEFNIVEAPRRRRMARRGSSSVTCTESEPYAEPSGYNRTFSGHHA